METSQRFFAQVRNLVVFLETERAKLEHAASSNINEEQDDTASGAVQALHELHSEVRGLKKRVQSQVASHQAGNAELSSFIRACMVVKQRTTEDLDRIRSHYEKYGYKPQEKAFQKTSEGNGKGETESRRPVEEVPGRGLTGVTVEEEEEEAQVRIAAPETPEKTPPAADDQMRTPQLSDFGLSTFHLQMVLGNAEPSDGVARPPALTLSPPPFVMTTEPSQPKTPRCSLRMDEDAPTPRLEDFGITEHTMCLNNDFTMDLFRKNPTKDRNADSFKSKMGDVSKHHLKTPPQNTSTLPSGGQSQKCSRESMESPEVPVFSILEITVNKQLAPPSAPSTRESEPQSPPGHGNGAATPELPVFETPYITKLVSARKGGRQDRLPSLTSLSEPSECLPGTVALSDQPQMPVGLPQEKNTTPEMPSMQSYFGSSLPCMGGGRWADPLAPAVPTEEEHTQDWCLATPRLRMDFQEEPRTPEMPDMSSVTQDIFKLVSQGNCKKPTATSVQQTSKARLQTSAPGKENRAHSLAPVSEEEFHRLASYMKQIPLSSLNQAIDKLNRVTEERCRDGEPNFEVFHMEDLRKLLEAGPQAPMYILGLVELKRLENVQGFGRNATFKILTKTSD
ncbi:spindle and kinetochore-associated protein 3 [Electrophorus electricus]|uniref:spindle and kinetochore-associated protein 3 n=1 Tax=Electrophorus electricus TaxID=8005 RepID=UPI0015CFDD63|nr:spindle and kinetochore-associated protein 3 [Electrophorus electricus]